MRDTIFELDNVLSKDQCKKIIDLFESDPNIGPGHVSGGIRRPDVKTSIDLRITRADPTWKDIDALLENSLTQMISKYKHHLHDEFKCFRFNAWSKIFDNLEDTGYNIQRTDPGGFFTWHNDYEPMKNRILTFIWYLNDVNPEDGGYTEFIDGRRIQPKAGKFIMFPATWTCTHRGFTLKKGKKYIVTGWLYYNSD